MSPKMRVDGWRGEVANDMPGTRRKLPSWRKDSSGENFGPRGTIAARTHEPALLAAKTAHAVCDNLPH